MNPAFQFNQYLLKRQVFALAGKFRFFDPSNRLVLYSEQKMFKIREDIRVYSDESKTQEVLMIKARQIIDFSAAYDVGAALWQWNKADRKLVNLWKKADALDCHYTTPVYHAGHVYGLHGRQESGMTLRCIVVADGKVAWEAPGSIQGGTLILVGDKFLLHSESGELWIFNATPSKFDLLQRSQITRAGHRSHGAFSNGLLYARDAEKMVAVKVK